MNTNRKWQRLVTVSLAMVTAVLLPALPTSANAQDNLEAIGLAAGGNRIVRFNTRNPGNTRVQIDNLSSVFAMGDTRLIGIDFRIQDERLYGVGDMGGIYLFNQNIKNASRVGGLPAGTLAGNVFGVDVNPVRDVLRIISDTGQNVAVPFANLGSLEIGTNLNGDDFGARGAAYTNNDRTDLAAATVTHTTLFTINRSVDAVAIQSPDNRGTLISTGALRVGFTLGDPGFDIYSRLNNNGVTVENTAFASLLPFGGDRGLYRIDLLTGRARLVDEFDRNVTDIAIRLNQ